MASARDMPSMTRSWISFHLAAAAGADASLQRITRARLKGTPAARRLESKRVKFSSIRPEILVDDPTEIWKGEAGRAPAAPEFAPADLSAGGFSTRAGARVGGA